MKYEWMEVLSEITKRQKLMPIGIEVNPEWLEVQIKTGNIINKKSKGDVDLSVLSSVPVFLNSGISSYKFVFEEEKSEYFGR